ncbi:phasin, PhaP [Meridianimarinicoccus aquatilis]|uniref:Phasin, PhaP n=1 Tax=Meridianimarinicoccus aquatilis TaxID=2552766 RepID=A0A4R6AJV2_9RHOB|nr:phasin, PhaP [Fluviibacterium aquatile]TDL81723.1 phasin, PhaP [Fluviibacterium aquatile]
MTNIQDFTSFFKAVPTGVDSATMTDAWKIWATFGERFSAITLDAANKSNDITTKTVKDTLALLRTVSKVQDEPADYAKVVSDFGAAQSELVKTHFESLGDVAKLAQTDATELMTTTGQHIAEQGSKAANDAGTKVKTAASKATKAA